MYFPFSIPKSGRKRSAHGRRRFIQRFPSILLVEQNAYKALSIANRAYILETGEITKDGKASDLITDKAVISAYLGG